MARDSSLVFWRNGQAGERIEFPSRIRSLATNEDHSLLFAGCESGCVYTVQVGTGKFTELTKVNGARVQTLHYQSGKLLAGCSNGILRVVTLAENRISREFNLGNSVDFVRINQKQDMLLVGCNNRLIYAFQWSNLSLQPLHLEDVNPAAHTGILQDDGSLYLSCQDNSLRKRSMSSDWLQSHVSEQIRQEVKKEEFKKLLKSKDIPSLQME